MVAYLADSMKKRALISQVLIILYSALAAILGRSYITLIVIILFLAVFMAVQSRLSKGPLGQGRVRVEDVLAGKELVSESGVREIQMKDGELALDLQRQSKFIMYMNLVAIVGLGYFILLWGMIDRLFTYINTNIVADERIAYFLAFLIYFEGYFVLSQAAMYYAMKKAGKIYTLNVPSEYTVTKKGVVYKGLIFRSAIAFPLPEDVKIRYNEKRRFVEIERDTSRAVNVIRLYSRNPKRLYEVIRKYGLARKDEEASQRVQA